MANGYLRHAQMTDFAIPNCPHCGRAMTAWDPPPDTGWAPGEMYLCLNDECAYFRNGFQTMMERYSVKASYRWLVNAHTGKGRPIAASKPPGATSDG